MWVKEIEDKGEGEGKMEKEKEERRREKGKGQGYLSQRDKGLPLDRKETDMAHRKMAVYKSKMENPMLG